MLEEEKTRAESVFPLETFLIEIKSLTTCWCIIPKKDAFNSESFGKH